MKPLPFLAVAVVSCCPGFAARAQTPQSRNVAVVVGGDETVDACALGKVIGLDPAFVRAGPAASKAYRETDRRTNGQFVYVCAEKGKWYGVVYHPSGEAKDCGVASPIARRRPYVGPCKSGWMEQNVVDVVAD